MTGKDLYPLPASVTSPRIWAFHLGQSPSISLRSEGPGSALLFNLSLTDATEQIGKIEAPQNRPIRTHRLSQSSCRVMPLTSSGGCRQLGRNAAASGANAPSPREPTLAESSLWLFVFPRCKMFPSWET